MRLVTCIGSISSGKTCLLNILQQNTSDGKCMSIKEQDEIFSYQKELNCTPKQESVLQIKSEEPSNKSKNKIDKLGRNKIVPISEGVIDNGTVKTILINASEPTKIEKRYSDLLGKTTPTVGVNHFEFTVDDLTLQVAGEYWNRKKNKNSFFCPKINCQSPELNSDKAGVIELKELGGQIGEYYKSIVNELCQRIENINELNHKLLCLFISAPLWKSMISSTTVESLREKSRCLIFLVDASNTPAYLSEAAVHLIELLNYLQTTKKHSRVLIVYSKVDLIHLEESCERILSNIKQLLRISYLKTWYSKDITIKEIEYSAVTGQGVEKIRYWLNHCYLY